MYADIVDDDPDDFADVDDEMDPDEPFPELEPRVRAFFKPAKADDGVIFETVSIEVTIRGGEFSNDWSVGYSTLPLTVAR